MNFENIPRFASQTSGSKTIQRFSEKQPTNGELGPARDKRPLPLLCSAPCHDAERTGAAMNFLDDLRAEWIAIRKSLGDHIAYLEAGNRIHPIDQDPNEATAECLERLRQYRSEVEGWLIHLPSQGE